MIFLVAPQKMAVSYCDKYCFIDCWRVGSCGKKKAILR